MGLNVGVIGIGNMGFAIIEGIASRRENMIESINIYDKNAPKRDIFNNRSNIKIASCERTVVESSDIIILAVKPDKIKSVLESCTAVISNEKIIISIAVGISIAAIANVIGSDKKIVRTMPNTPALVGEGMTLISHNTNVTGPELTNIVSLFECLGKVELLNECLMSEVTALTGSSPAYVFMMIEAMSDAAVRSGIPRDLSYRLAAQAVLGSAKMVLETSIHPGKLKDQVCSPGGTTIEAVKSLEKNGFRHAIIEAMEQCTKRALEIAKKAES